MGTTIGVDLLCHVCYNVMGVCVCVCVCVCVHTTWCGKSVLSLLDVVDFIIFVFYTSM